MPASSAPPTASTPDRPRPLRRCSTAWRPRPTRRPRSSKRCGHDRDRARRPEGLGARGQHGHACRRPGRHLHPALLLPQEAHDRGQLPDVPGRDREGAQADAGLRDAGDAGHGRSHQERQGDQRAAGGDGVPPHQPPARLPDLRPGGECLLQDLAVGYGASNSRYDEDKRVVYPKDVGPLLSMQEMNRCIHCTRCVRFGQEIGGVMELGMLHRGKHSEITTIAGDTVDSELSGNMIDLCPVGAITSKPFRYSARAWELSRRKSVSPHDSTGANLIVQVKLAEVKRVLPFENEDVNECWIADRDRFSYEALVGPERLTAPMIRRDGEWKTVAWSDALDHVARSLTQISVEHGAQSIGALASPMSTVEELHLLARLVRGLGSDNVDTRLRETQPPRGGATRWLGRSIASLAELQRVLVVGSFLRKDHPLLAQRIRQATKR